MMASANSSFRSRSLTPSSSSSRLGSKVRRAASKVRKAAPLAATCGGIAIGCAVSPMATADLCSVCDDMSAAGTSGAPSEVVQNDLFFPVFPRIFPLMDDFFPTIPRPFNNLAQPTTRVQVFADGNGRTSVQSSYSSYNQESFYDGDKFIVSMTTHDGRKRKVEQPSDDAMTEISDVATVTTLSTLKGLTIHSDKKSGGAGKFNHMLKLIKDPEIKAACEDSKLVFGQSITDPEVDRYVMLFREKSGKEKALWIVGTKDTWKKAWVDLPDAKEDVPMVVVDEYCATSPKPAQKPAQARANTDQEKDDSDNAEAQPAQQKKRQRRSRHGN